MTWSDLYLLCFLLGFSLSVVSFFAGATHLHLPFKMHVPFHVMHHGPHVGVRAGLRGGSHVSWFNASSILAFLAWFGGTGYILTNYSQVIALTSLAIATVAGLIAATLVFKFMAKIIRVTEAQLLDWDFRLEGSVGTVSAPIRPNGVGEVLFEQNGVCKSAIARTEDGSALAKGSEVVIARYEDGVAYVKPWEEFTK
jgi:membrane protein implicated in regulation of membrane protease activity